MYKLLTFECQTSAALWFFYSSLTIRVSWSQHHGRDGSEVVEWCAENCTIIVTEMNSGSTRTVIIGIENMALRTQNSFFRSGICRIFNSWNTSCASNRSKFSCFGKSLQEAPNVNNRSLLASSIVAAKKYQTQTYKSAVKCIKKERRIMYSTSTSALEEGKTLSLTGPLTKIQAHDLIMRLTREERTALLTALQEFQAEKRKAEYEGRIYYVSMNESFSSVCFSYFWLKYNK